VVGRAVEVRESVVRGVRCPAHGVAYRVPAKVSPVVVRLEPGTGQVRDPSGRLPRTAYGHLSVDRRRTGGRPEDFLSERQDGAQPVDAIGEVVPGYSPLHRAVVPRRCHGCRRDHCLVCDSVCGAVSEEPVRLCGWRVPLAPESRGIHGSADDG